MQTMEGLRNQVENTRDLSSIARAMKALAAVRIRQSREAVQSLGTYALAVERGFQILVKKELRGFDFTRDAPGSTVALVMGSDLGMVGGFNRSMAEFVLKNLEGTEAKLVTVGERIAAELESDQGGIEARFPMPDRVDAMAERVQDLLLSIEELRARHEPRQVLVFHHAYLSGSEYEPRKIQLLPLDPIWLGMLAEKPWPAHVLPSYRVSASELLSSMLREHLFLSLFRAMAESHASENASRLAAMESAEQKIQDRLQELTGRLKQQRQQQMTEELLDIMAGAAALEEEGGWGE